MIFCLPNNMSDGVHTLTNNPCIICVEEIKLTKLRSFYIMKLRKSVKKKE